LFYALLGKGVSIMQVIPFLLPGIPDERTSLQFLLDFLSHPNFPFVEVGLPSRNPYLDGAVIRTAHRKLRESGFGFGRVLRLLEEQVRDRDTRKIILMGYLHDLEEFGVIEFQRHIDALGPGGLILVGPHEKVLALRDRLAVPLVPLVTVRSTAKTLLPFLGERPPFIYFRVSTKRTGEGDSPPLPLIRRALNTVREMFPGLPVFAGFGIGDRKKASLLKDLSFSGVVVGSALLERIMAGHPVRDFLRELEEL